MRRQQVEKCARELSMKRRNVLEILERPLAFNEYINHISNV